MRSYQFLIFFTLGVVLLSLPAHAGPDISEGQWEITVKMEIPGMPMAMPAVTNMQCLTTKDHVPWKTQQSDACKLSDSKTKGNTVYWTVKCGGQNASTTTGEITYSGDTFEGVMNIETAGAPQMTSHIKGKRVGPCKK